MDSVNDNIRSPDYDDPAWEMMKLKPLYWGDLPKQLRRRLPAWFLPKEARSIGNFLWYVKFQTEWDRQEVIQKRNEIGVVK